MLLLDLYCGAGGASVGYHRAGFDVVGVDHRRQPRYPFSFVQADALEYMAHVYPYAVFDAIHASPPCQANTSLRHLTGKMYPDLLTPTRDLLRKTGLPWVIENVPGAPMRPDLVLCGEMFGLAVRRHRWFETSPILFDLMPRCRHATTPVGVYGHPGGTSGRDYRRTAGDANYYRRAGADVWAKAMGIDWMTARELAQAIPPAYTRHVGGLLLDVLRERVA